MEIEVKGKVFGLKFDFRAARAIKNITYDDSKEMAAVVTGLLDADPEVIADLVQAGLSYLKAKAPTPDDIFNAVSDLFNEKDPEIIAQEMMDELVQSGFFKSKIKVWAKNQKKYLKLFGDRLFSMKENAEEEEDSEKKQDMIGKVKLQEEMKKQLELQLSKVEKLISKK